MYCTCSTEYHIHVHCTCTFVILYAIIKITHVLLECLHEHIAFKMYMYM